MLPDPYLHCTQHRMLVDNWAISDDVAHLARVLCAEAGRLLSPPHPQLFIDTCSFHRMPPTSWLLMMRANEGLIM